MEEFSKNGEKWDAKDLIVFFERLKTTSGIKRFGTMPMIQFESVAAHSYNVAMMALLIADFEDSGKIDKEMLLRKALVHDFEESILSDIPHSIKHRYKGGQLAKMLKELVPGLIREEIFKELPRAMREEYAHHSQTAKEGLEGRIVEAADAMDTVVTAIREMHMGNRYFEKVLRASLAMVQKHTDLKFVKIFWEKAQEYVSRDQEPITEHI